MALVGTRKQFYQTVCGRLGTLSTLDKPNRFVAFYRDEGPGSYGYIQVSFDTLAELKYNDRAHEHGRYIVEVDDTKRLCEPLWVLNEVWDLDACVEVKFYFSLNFVGD